MPEIPMQLKESLRLYRWDFGDGETSETVTGFTSHIYDVFGAYTVSLEVENDQGGIDEAITIIIVNGAPTIDLTFPENPRAGDAVLLDASESTDPESAELAFSWDLDWGVDSDGDGDGRNDVDSTEPQALLPTNTSGIYVGSLTIDDGQGGVVTEVFEINVSARQFNIEWKEKSFNNLGQSIWMKVKNGRKKYFWPTRSNSFVRAST